MNNNYINRGYHKTRKIGNYALNKTKGKIIDLHNKISETKKFKFSIIIAIYNTEKYLAESIESIINQTIGFDSIELILIDDGSTDESKEICLKYQKKYPNNIKYIYQENNGQASARNKGLDIASGIYINFLDSDDKLELNALELIYDFFAEYYHLVDVVSIPIKFFDREYGDHILNYKYEKTRLIDLNRNPDYIQLSASSSFFKKESIKNNKFNTELIISEDSLFLNKILLEKTSLGVISNTAYFYRKRNEKGSTIDSSIMHKDYYIHRSKNYFKELFEYSNKKYGKILDFIKYTIMYELQWMFNIQDVSKILSSSESTWLYDSLYNLLQEIDDDIILNQKHKDTTLLKSILTFKHDGKIETLKSNKNVIKQINGKTIDELHYHVLYFDQIEIAKNKLYILGFLRSFFKTEELAIEAVKYNELQFIKEWETYFNMNKELFIDQHNEENQYYSMNDIENLKKEDSFDLNTYNKKYNETFDDFINENAEIIPAISMDYPSRTRHYLNLSYDTYFNFECAIPLCPTEHIGIKLRVKYDNLTYYLKTSTNYYSKLTSESFYSKKENYLIKYVQDTLKVMPHNDTDLMKLEKENIKYLESKNDAHLNKPIEFRKNYMKYYSEFKNKRIWLFIDRPEMADDNAEHLFKYSIKQDDNIDKYFIISNKSKDFKRLNEFGNIINYKSKEHMILSCFAEKIISSHPDDEIVNPFFGEYEKYLNGLFSAKICFLQHGITLNNVSSWLRKYDKFLSLIITASKKEYNSFFENPYNYSESVVQLLGFPRYDKLKKGSEKNQILIMPTWRRFLRNNDEHEIRESEYIKKINSLLNNKELIEYCKNNRYELIFKPHPNLYEYINFIEPDEFIKIDYDSSYQKLLKESKLFITDYSSIAFDFAYMKKPVIYYQCENNEFHFNLEESYFDFNTMGFGEIVSTENKLVELIKKHIDSNCKMSIEFQKRADEFYEFEDNNNCKRVYEFISKMSH